MKKWIISFLICLSSPTFASDSNLITGVDFFELGNSKLSIISHIKKLGGREIQQDDDTSSFYPPADPIIFQNIKSNYANFDWVNAYFEKGKLYRVEILSSPWELNEEIRGFKFKENEYQNFQQLLNKLKQQYSFSKDGSEIEIFEGVGEDHACDKPIILKKKIWKIQSPNNIEATYTETRMLEPYSRRELNINDAATMDCKYPAEGVINIYNRDIFTSVMLLDDQIRLEHEEKFQDSLD